jgi:hypothetical protein
VKNFANIFFLAVLFVLPSVVQSDFSATQNNELEIAHVAQNNRQSNVPQEGIYDPFLPFKGETSLSFSIKVPKPDVNEELNDQFSREALNKTSYPDNTASYIATSSQIDVGLSIKKLIFPFHSFL